MDRYFVVIFARDAAALRALQQFELDVFPQTAKPSNVNAEYPFSIDGLLSMLEIAKLVRASYRVLVEDPLERRARVAGNVGEFPQWLKRMESLVDLQRKSP